MKTYVADIERCSTHDGPGLRTVVFLKGCPLRCAWCHNPECISFEKDELFYADKCIGCGHCSEGCVTGARVICGRDMTTDEVLAEVLADRDYYGAHGGVTVSGGEPLAHRDFTLELLQKCRTEGIGTAVETSLFRYDEELLSLCDYIMTDVKIFDSAEHERYTGIGNHAILENIRRADSLGIPIIVRTPIVTGVNDSADNIRRTAEFVRLLKNARKYELLPYHPLGLSKARALGREMTEFVSPTKEKMEELKKYADIS